MLACVSVLIPVFNAELYLRQAVLSALQQPETGEVLLLDDGSTDSSLSLCRELAKEYELVRLIRYPDGENQNRGAAAARNLLIKHSRCKYIAFLDADDYFLPGRFAVAVKILESNPEIHVIYDAFEKRFEDPSFKQKWLEETPPNERILKLGPSKPVDNLFERVMVQYRITPNIWQIVARCEVYQLLPPFNENLVISPDPPILFQMLALFRFAPGQLNEPKIVYRIHGSNLYQGMRRSNPRKSRQVLLKWLDYFWEWAEGNLDARKLEFVKIYLLRQSMHIAPLFISGKLRPRRLFLNLQRLVGLIVLPFYFRRMAYSRIYWRTLMKTFFGCSSNLN